MLNTNNARNGGYKVSMGVLQNGADNLAWKLPDIEDLVNLATVISKKALHKFLMIKSEEQMMELNK